MAGASRMVPGAAICSMRAARWVVWPERRVIHVQIATRWTRTTTAPELSPTRIWTGTPCARKTASAYRGDGLLHPQGRVAGPHGVVLVGERRAEQRHDPIAHDLVDGALVAVHGLHHPFQHGIEQLARLLGVAIGEQFHRALEVGEEHGDLLALALQGGLGGEDLLGEVLWGVRLRGRRTNRGRRASGDRVAALEAEAGAARVVLRHRSRR